MKTGADLNHLKPIYININNEKTQSINSCRHKTRNY